MTKLGIKLGDTVVVIAGKDKGKTGVVKATSVKTNRVIVEGINIQFKTKKARRANEKSEIVKQEGPIDCSNVMVICPTCGKATRVGRKSADGKNFRICKKCGANLEAQKKAVKAAKKTKTAAQTETKVESTEDAATKTTTVNKPKTTKTTKTTTATKKTAAPKASAKKVSTRGDR